MSRNKHIPYYFGSILFILELSFGIWMAHWNHFIPGDAVSRVANSYYVLFSRDPHLGAIGFVWNPLPSLLTIPILLLNPWCKVLASEGIAGIILTALFAAFTSVLLFKALLRRKQPFLFSFAFVLLFSFNPFLFLYGSNGMSEMLFICFIMFCIIAFTDWLDEKRSVTSMIMIGFALALALLTRYESVVFGAALALSLFIIIWSRRRKGEAAHYGIAYTYNKWEASEWIALLPALYTGIIWMALNWAIMGDGLFFLRSNYSNLAQSEGLSKNPTIGPVIGDYGNTLLFVAERSLPFLLPFLAVLIIRILRRRVFKAGFLCLFFLLMSIPLMQVYMLHKGASYGWLRFFVYPFVITLAWLPYELQKLKEQARRLYILGGCITLILLSASAYTTGYAMNNERLSPEEYQAIHYKKSATYASNLLSQKIAEDLDDRLRMDSHASLLLDSFNGFQIILDMDQTKQLIITSDLDFKKKLNDPVNEHVTYILVPKPDGVAALNAVNERYKSFYEQGADFAKLDKTYSDQWRLYRVVKPMNENE
ncbi:glycosyltransferase family 39 protein [Sporolactobacillus sp. CPB3-1]|uniref:Glycosyltransferase family 39 protein n=1 Tax=Sporolactobacillus mangiferae TaxID=2940498 RepID=A0ABT0MD22_9BACL|nr:glycosyltransferase family 39 protein [Sporolactobacillus mangiferae]MCL1632761.1 glycosyltransferase family 39 protein [Sporolactobacillus mangiferae]